MKIYSQEKTYGLEEVIQANSSLAYVSQLRPSNPDESQKLKIKASLESSKANSNKDQTDLYYIDSVLVTTCWCCILSNNLKHFLITKYCNLIN